MHEHVDRAELRVNLCRGTACPVFSMGRSISDLQVMPELDISFKTQDTPTQYIEPTLCHNNIISLLSSLDEVSERSQGMNGYINSIVEDKACPFQQDELQSLRTFDEFEDINIEDEETVLQPGEFQQGEFERLCRFDGFEGWNPEQEVSPPQPGELKRLRTFDEFEDYHVEDEDRLKNTFPQSIQKNGNLLGSGNSTQNSFVGHPFVTSAFSNFVPVSGKQGVLQCTIAPEGGLACVEWMVGAKKLVSTDRQLISPVFEFKRLRLKFILHARGSTTGQKSASLRNSGGIGSLSLKSDEINIEDHALGCITYRVAVGNSCDEWSSHDFMKTPFLRCKREWNFRKAVDKTTKHTKVRLEITSHSLGQLMVCGVAASKLIGSM